MILAASRGPATSHRASEPHDARLFAAKARYGAIAAAIILPLLTLLLIMTAAPLFAQIPPPPSGMGEVIFQRDDANFHEEVSIQRLSMRAHYAAVCTSTHLRLRAARSRGAWRWSSSNIVV